MALFRRGSTSAPDGRRQAAAFARALWAEPDGADVEWLATTATGGDADHARWELRYARRALGLLVAQRDALDDRTGSLVARALDEAMAADANVAADLADLAARQLNERLAAYRDALDVRSPEPRGARMGRVLLVFAGSVRAARGAGLGEAGAVCDRYLAELGAALAAAFGEASLPDDRPPSTLRPRGRG
jgi:hypothetical protein